MTEAPVRLHGVPHPFADVRQAGFPLDHPYLEECWASALGPSSVLLLRRMPVLWQASMPAEIELGELAASIGLSRGIGPNSPVHRTIDRLARFRFAERSGDLEITLFTEVPPLPRSLLQRAPQWTRDRHEQLLSRHLDDLVAEHQTPATEAGRTRQAAADRSPAAPRSTRPRPTPSRSEISL